MRVEELDYELPPGCVATHPAEPRDASKLLVYRRATGTVEHRVFRDLPDLLGRGDLLVVNDTKVVPAKLELRKLTGAAIPGLFLKELGLGLWQVMLRSRGKLKVGDELAAAGDEGAAGFRFRLRERLAGKGEWVAEVEPAMAAGVVLGRIGHVPLPPYIEKARGPGKGEAERDREVDRERYQTVYAKWEGSVAAPTAGLHFTPELLGRLRDRGIEQAAVTLHVGLGTFLPVEAATLGEHKMHAEEFVVPGETVRKIREVRARGGRVVAVGTTAVRTLESAAEGILGGGEVREIAGVTELLIEPGFRFRLTDVLVTNFHLPRSTLLALVGAMVGMEKLKALYAEAIREGYRFYSYGDAMVVLP